MVIQCLHHDGHYLRRPHTEDDESDRIAEEATPATNLTMPAPYSELKLQGIQAGRLVFALRPLAASCHTHTHIYIHISHTCKRVPHIAIAMRMATWCRSQRPKGRHTPAACMEKPHNHMCISLPPHQLAADLAMAPLRTSLQALDKIALLRPTLHH